MNVNFEKYIQTLPDTLKPNTFYYVRNGQGFDTYLSDASGKVAHKQNSSNYVEKKISSF